MSAGFACRTLVAATALLSACSQTPGESEASVPNGPSAGAAGAATVESIAGAAGSAGAQWNVIAESQDSNLFASAPVAASRGKDAAVAYLEWTNATPSVSRVVMQRFDATAQRVGALVELGSEPEQDGVTLASDGKQYLACWSAATEVHCSLVDEQDQVHPNALALAGQYPTVVASPSGWAIGYETSDTQLRLQALTPALEMSGSPVDMTLPAPFRYAGAGPLLTPTPSGFALVATRPEDGHDALLRLGSDLQPVAAPIPLGRDFWFYGQLVASDTRAAVSLSFPYGSYLMLLDAAQVTAELAVAGGGKEGIDQALLISSGGIAAAWLDGDVEVQRRFFADGQDAEIGLGTRTPPDAPIDTLEQGSDSYQQLLRVGAQTLLVGRFQRSGSLKTTAIRAGVVTFP